MSENKSLFAITTDLKKMDEMLVESDGELTPEIELVMEQVSCLLKTKTDGITSYVRSKEAFLKTVNDELIRINSIKTKTINAMESFDKYIIGCMEKMGKIEIQGELSKIKIKKPHQVVEIINENDINIKYIKKKTTVIKMIEKAKIKKALKNNEKVNGAKLSLGKKTVIYS